MRVKPDISLKGIIDLGKEMLCKASCDKTRSKFCQLQVQGKSGPEALREAYIPEIKKQYPWSPERDAVIKMIEDARSRPVANGGSLADGFLAGEIQKAQARTGFRTRRNTISWTTSDIGIFNHIIDLCKELNISRNVFLKEAIEHYLPIAKEKANDKIKTQKERKRLQSRMPVRSTRPLWRS